MKWWNNLKISLKFGIITILIIGVCCFCLGLLAYYGAKGSLENQIKQTMETTVNDGANLIDAKIKNYFTAVEAVADLDVIKSETASWEEQKNKLAEEAEKYGFMKFGIADLSGNAKYSNGSSTNIAQREYFKNALAGKTNISDPLMSTAENKIVVVIAAPVYNQEKVSKVIMATVDSNFISEITNGIKLLNSGYAYLLNSSGTIIAHPDNNKVINQENNIKKAETDSSLKGLAEIEKKMIAKTKGFSSYSYNRKVYDMAYSPLSNYGWSLAVTVLKSELYADVYSLRVFIIIEIIGFLVVGIGLMILCSMFIIVRPVKKLKKVADRLAVGDVSVKVSTGNRDEIGLLTESVANMVENIRTQANNAQRIADGDLNVEIVPKSKVDLLANSMNKMKNSLNALINDSQMIVNAAVEGNLSVRADTSNHKGSYLAVIEGLNNILEAIVNPLKVALYQLQKIAAGEKTQKLENHYPGVYYEFINNLNSVRDSIEELMRQSEDAAAAAQKGNLSFRADLNGLQGVYRQIMESINSTLDRIMEPIGEASDVLKEMSEGNLQVRMTGEYEGDYRIIKDSLNMTLENLSDYVNEISETLAHISDGNLDLTVTGRYSGDFTEIKVSLENIIDSLNNVMKEIDIAANQVASGAEQVSDSAQSLSQAASEQASSVEEINASMEQIAAQTAQNASNAKKANELASSAKNDAQDGNSQMKKMLSAMDDINESSRNISKIIKVIDDIAFQTNILALNAAVEAARAGQHGKGFAVVAEEVRNLAAKSASAAKETTELINNTVGKVGLGSEIAENTARSLAKITESVSMAADLVSDIAKSSEEQSVGIAQVNRGVNQFSQSVQSNSATSQETAAASEELSSQAELLKNMIGRFKVKKQ